ncbi:hypothetical protein TWF694_009846 [Orbilia ellipsospora]|uniref:Uncharacterized protein n=1 Tax=Orbilia ellipsospora TaxID=2528407 RepID=A0AAV9XD15_9PEZI
MPMCPYCRSYNSRLKCYNCDEHPDRQLEDWEKFYRNRRHHSMNIDEERQSRHFYEPQTRQISHLQSQISDLSSSLAALCDRIDSTAASQAPDTIEKAITTGFGKVIKEIKELQSIFTHFGQEIKSGLDQFHVNHLHLLHKDPEVRHPRSHQQPHARQFVTTVVPLIFPVSQGVRFAQGDRLLHG